MEPDVPPNDEGPVDHEAPDAGAPSVDHDEASTRPAPQPRPQLDLDRVERDLADVETALERLDDATYWTDEITGAPISDDALAADPLRRRAPTNGGVTS